MFKQLNNIILSFKADSDKVNILELLSDWYMIYERLIDAIEVESPLMSCSRYYIRNIIYSCDEYDIFIHAMKPMNSTVIHGHGDNDVFVIPINQDIGYTNYMAQNIQQEVVKLHITSSGALKSGKVYHQAANGEFVHRIYNENNSYVKFLEIYLKPYNVLPIYLCLHNSEHMAVVLNECNYSIAENLFGQIISHTTSSIEFNSTQDLLNYAKDYLFRAQFILLENDKVIITYEGLQNYLHGKFANKYTIYNTNKGYVLLTIN